MIHVLASHVTAELAFFQVQIEVFGAQAAFGGQADLGHAPKRFDAVDVVAAGSEFVAGVVDAVVASVAPIDSSVAVPPAGGVDGARKGSILSLITRLRAFLEALGPI